MMNGRRLGTVFASTALALGSVAAVAPAVQAHAGGGSAADGITGSWARTSEHGAAQTLVFDGKKVSGKAGCNRFFGTVKIDGKKVDFGPLGSTLMACEQAVMDDEQAFLQVLDTANKAVVKGNKLTISGPDGKLVFEPMKQPRK